ncbi:MAG: GntR family transcriptional regulator [Anaerolineae bacterium]
MAENESGSSLSQAAYERIKQQIVSLQLAPGAVIDEATLQAELNLGRTPIREALKRLSLEKLVNIVPRRGMFVTDIGVMDLHYLFEVRVPLESLAARLATQRGTGQHWAQMSAALAQIPPQGIPLANETLIQIDRTCHEIVYQATANKFLQDTLVTMYTLSLRLWYYALAQITDMRSAVLEHAAILNALEQGQADEAARLTERHIRSFQDEIQAAMLGKSQ